MMNVTESDREQQRTEVFGKGILNFKALAICCRIAYTVDDRFTVCGTETLFTKASGANWRSLVFGGIRMIERGLYYATQDFSTMIQNVGGTWNERSGDH